MSPKTFWIFSRDTYEFMNRCSFYRLPHPFFNIPVVLGVIQITNATPPVLDVPLSLEDEMCLRWSRTGTNATPPASKDGVFNCSEHLRLTVHSGAPSRMARSSTVHCQSELLGTVRNRSLLAGGVAFDILRFWKDDYLQTSEYSLQGIYKGGSNKYNGE